MDLVVKQTNSAKNQLEIELKSITIEMKNLLDKLNNSIAMK